MILLSTWVLLCPRVRLGQHLRNSLFLLDSSAPLALRKSLYMDDGLAPRAPIHRPYTTRASRRRRRGVLSGYVRSVQQKGDYRGLSADRSLPLRLHMQRRGQRVWYDRCMRETLVAQCLWREVIYDP